MQKKTFKCNGILLKIGKCFCVKAAEVVFNQQNSITIYKNTKEVWLRLRVHFWPQLRHSKMLLNSFFTHGSLTTHSNLEIGHRNEKKKKKRPPAPQSTHEPESWYLCKRKHHIIHWTEPQPWLKSLKRLLLKHFFCSLQYSLQFFTHYSTTREFKLLL